MREGGGATAEPGAAGRPPQTCSAPGCRIAFPGPRRGRRLRSPRPGYLGATAPTLASWGKFGGLPATLGLPHQRFSRWLRSPRNLNLSSRGLSLRTIHRRAPGAAPKRDAPTSARCRRVRSEAELAARRIAGTSPAMTSGGTRRLRPRSSASGRAPGTRGPPRLAWPPGPDLAACRRRTGCRTKASPVPANPPAMHPQQWRGDGPRSRALNRAMSSRSPRARTRPVPCS
jgi:hypothetical protein